eukprot:1152229-Pelagomonas_calceolata.AAC.5
MDSCSSIQMQACAPLITVGYGGDSYGGSRAGYSRYSKDGVRKRPFQQQELEPSMMMARRMTAAFPATKRWGMTAPGKEGEHEPAAFNLLIFGDSLSDTGNLFALTQDTPDPEVYFQGRFSNGYIWPDYLDASTKGSVRSWAVTNYAFISATACPFCASQEHVLPITEQ